MSGPRHVAVQSLVRQATETRDNAEKAIEKVRNDPSYLIASNEAQQMLEARLRREADQKCRELAFEAERLVKGAEQAARQKSPRAIQLAAASANPSRVADIERMASRLPLADVLWLAEEALASNDMAAAVGIRSALGQMAPEEQASELVGQIMATTWKAGTSLAEGALRDLASTKQEYARMMGVAFPLEPAAMMRAADEARLLPDHTGQVRRHSDAEIRELVGAES